MLRKDHETRLQLRVSQAQLLVHRQQNLEEKKPSRVHSSGRNSSSAVEGRRLWLLVCEQQWHLVLPHHFRDLDLLGDHQQVLTIGEEDTRGSAGGGVAAGTASPDTLPQ